MNQPPRHWRMERDIDGVCWLTIDRAGKRVNTVAREVLEELEQLVPEIERTAPRGLVLLSGKRGNFIAGADITEFNEVTTVDEAAGRMRRVHRLFDRIEQLPFPTAVAIEGFCLGGGLELALCFGYRIARDIPETRFGFPELRLGIYPGYGGSARAIEKLGGLRALPLILQSRNLSARQAQAAGLVDQVIGRHEELRWAARRAVLAGLRSPAPALQARLSNITPARRLLAARLRKETAKRVRADHYPAPYALIDAFERHGDDRRAMLQAEEDNVCRLMVGETSRNLLRIYQLMERLKAEGKRACFTPRRAHVIGAGVMGGDIAAWCALQGIDVTLQDREAALIEPALERARKLFRKKLKTDAAVQAAQGRLRADVEGHGVARADVVIEAIFENLEAKQALLRRLEPSLHPRALLATNTSALSLRELAGVLTQPQRLIGLHFFNPVAQMPLVEVVYEPELTDPEQVSRGAACAVAIGKLPLPVRSAPGFLVNRVLTTYMCHALELHQQGIAKETVDQAAIHFGMPVGPIELADTVGLDVSLSVLRTIFGNSRAALTAELQRRIDAGRLGKKSGEGFYRWEKGKPVKTAVPESHDLERLGNELMSHYLRTCQQVMAEGVVADADLLDAGLVFGTGFPPFLGGPLHYLETQGQSAPAQGDIDE